MAGRGRKLNMKKLAYTTAITVLLVLSACSTGATPASEEAPVSQSDVDEVVQENEENTQNIEDQAIDEFMKYWEKRFTPCEWQIGDSNETIWTGVLAGGVCEDHSWRDVHQVLYLEPIMIGIHELTAADKANGFVMHYEVGPMDPAFRTSQIWDREGDKYITDIMWDEWESDTWDATYEFQGHEYRIHLYLKHDGEWVVETVGWADEWEGCSMPPEEVWPEFTCDDIQQ
jgi:hypothetical protein